MKPGNFQNLLGFLVPLLPLLLLITDLFLLMRKLTPDACSSFGIGEEEG